MANGCRRVIIPIGYRIYSLRGALSGSDITFTSANAAIVTQVVLHFSIMADTFPCMKPFLVAFDKGLDDGSSRYYAQQRGYILHSVGDDSTKPGNSQTWPDRVKTETNVEHTPIRPPTTATRSSPGDSSELMIIRKTQEWQITNEPAR